MVFMGVDSFSLLGIGRPIVSDKKFFSRKSFPLWRGMRCVFVVCFLRCFSPSSSHLFAMVVVGIVIGKESM